MIQSRVYEARCQSEDAIIAKVECNESHRHESSSIQKRLVRNRETCDLEGVVSQVTSHSTSTIDNICFPAVRRVGGGPVRPEEKVAIVLAIVVTVC
jgi:hypothetical protein